MIQKLRRRFLSVSMTAVMLVLLLLLGGINIANYASTDRQADELLVYLSENEGFPDFWFSFEPGHKGPAGHKAPPRYSPETPYETRYFTVHLNSQTGAFLSADTSNIAAVNVSQAAAIASSLWQQNAQRGYWFHYKYLATTASGITMYVFLDCSRNMESLQSFALSSLLVGVLGLAAVFVLLLAFSRKAVQPMAESYEKQRRFITNAGHEIKTPLSIIDSCTEVLELEQGQSKWTRGIRDQVQRLNGLTRNLVTLSRLDESNQPPLEKEPLDLSALAREILEPFALTAEQKQLQLKLDIEPVLCYTGSEAALSQLFSILADNALKYASGSPILLRLCRRGKRIHFITENPAEGLSPGDQPQFFDRFYRGDSSRSSQTPGYGIGLSLALAIAEAHGGSIRARSDGSTLTVTVIL